MGKETEDSLEQNSCRGMNELRCHMFSQKQISTEHLSPKKDAMDHLFLGVNFQVAVWQQVHIVKPVLPSPGGNGC